MKYLIIIIISFTTIKAQTYVNWSNKKLNYENFKKKPIQTTTPQGVLDSRLGWKIAETTGKLPDLYVYNNFNEDNSWISMKHDEVLKTMQLEFDLSELYARKIRKEFEILRNKNVKQREVYREKFNSMHKIFQKRLNKVANITFNQPSFYAIINKQIQDSLIIYKLYEIK